MHSVSPIQVDVIIRVWERIFEVGDCMRIGMPELIVILIAVVIIFGPKNLPKLGEMLGKTVKNVRDGIDGKLADDDSEAKAEAK